ncbi:MobF family relaxase [Pseudactinotalea sp. HY158]|uniref:MobF family relaxase n=1 Tax=Pseudactinotalea sp. HY158 TaxID=2654547 RepID=UPI00129D178D|nr:MobF family relaxase [Pseudactinotalea sp. HY158]QGH70574.1 relaxase domain-containing protein [Pseudactinotalea sp. HY158]
MPKRGPGWSLGFGRAGVSITTPRTPIRAGTGYEYLTRSVAAGDGDRLAADVLTRYYDQAGTPPGRWLGSGLAGLGSANGAGPGLRVGDRVSEEQMGRLFGMGHDPVTGEVLSRTFSAPDESGLSRSRAGFDLTFQIPKSASALWAIADAGVQALIVRAHHEAITETLAFLEREVLMTRAGRAGVAQLETRGLVAAAFDHFDSRAGDPHLHTHVVVANRVQGVDGKWRTLDSRALYRAVEALSRTHSALFADRLAQILPVEWTIPTARKRELGEVEIAGVPAQLREVFSQRRLAIVAARQDAHEEFVRAHGRAPSQRESRALRGSW